MCTIYGLIDSETLELRYVGQTVRPLEMRLAQHKRGFGANCHLNNWLRARPVSIITLESNPASLNEAEIRWIRELRDKGMQLLNIANGGEGGMRGRKHTVESRTKNRVAHIGRRSTLETRIKISMNNGMKNPEARTKVSIAHIGKKHTLETRAKMRGPRPSLLGNQNALGCKRSAEIRAKISMAMQNYHATQNAK